MRPIDADKLHLAKFPVATTDYSKGWNDAIMCITENHPTVDAVEVVRCLDCKFYNEDNCSPGCGWCEFLEMGQFDSHYCYGAERKE